MATSDMPKWMADLIEKGESVALFLEMSREMKQTERDERPADRELKKAEIERDGELRKAEIERDRELRKAEIERKGKLKRIRNQR
jgi:hypothetical protein